MELMNKIQEPDDLKLNFPHPRSDILITTADHLDDLSSWGNIAPGLTSTNYDRQQGYVISPYICTNVDI